MSYHEIWLVLSVEANVIKDIYDYVHTLKIFVFNQLFQLHIGPQKIPTMYLSLECGPKCGIPQNVSNMYIPGPPR